MKTIIQLLIVAVVVVACAQAFRSAWSYYEFKDAVEQEARYGNQKTTSDLHRRILEIAAQHGVPLEYGDVQVTRQGLETVVHVSYTESVRLISRVYSRDCTYDVSINVFPVRPLAIDHAK